MQAAQAELQPNEVQNTTASHERIFGCRIVNGTRQSSTSIPRGRHVCSTTSGAIASPRELLAKRVVAAPMPRSAPNSQADGRVRQSVQCFAGVSPSFVYRRASLRTGCSAGRTRALHPSDRPADRRRCQLSSCSGACFVSGCCSNIRSWLATIVDEARR
jgi:hypothetical protein